MQAALVNRWRGPAPFDQALYVMIIGRISAGLLLRRYTCTCGRPGQAWHVPTPAARVHCRAAPASCKGMPLGPGLGGCLVYAIGVTVDPAESDGSMREDM